MGPARWFRLSIGLVLLVGALWVLFSRLDAIWNGHPAYPTTLLVTAGVGLTLIGFAMYPWQPDPEPNGPPWEAEEAAAAARTAPKTRHGWRTAGRVVIAVLAVGVDRRTGLAAPVPRRDRGDGRAAVGRAGHRHRRNHHHRTQSGRPGVPDGGTGVLTRCVGGRRPAAWPPAHRCGARGQDGLDGAVVRRAVRHCSGAGRFQPGGTVGLKQGQHTLGCTQPLQDVIAEQLLDQGHAGRADGLRRAVHQARSRPKKACASGGRCSRTVTRWPGRRPRAWVATWR